ncbi:hypothetical protein ACHAWF_001554 [Thalassiosira exigua]
MLLKSRSVGEKRLRMEDRFHLEVVRVWDAPGPDGCLDEARRWTKPSDAARSRSSVGFWSTCARAEARYARCGRTMVEDDGS